VYADLSSVKLMLMDLHPFEIDYGDAIVEFDSDIVFECLNSRSTVHVAQSSTNDRLMLRTFMVYIYSNTAKSNQIEKGFISKRFRTDTKILSHFK
jgi:hypothetical protein